MINKLKLFALLVIISTMVGCNNKRVYDTYTPIANSGWHQDSLISFSFDINDTLGNYSFYINLRNTNSYAYSNLWLFVDMKAPDETMRLDTFEIQLARPDGRWQGKGVGSLYDLQTPFRKNVYFPMAGTYTVTFQHGMRNEVLEGLHDIGVRVEKF